MTRDCAYAPQRSVLRDLEVKQGRSQNFFGGIKVFSSSSQITSDQKKKYSRMERDEFKSHLRPFQEVELTMTNLRQEKRSHRLTFGGAEA